MEAACGFALDAPGFHPSVLTYWRKRLAASDRPDRIFDAVTQVDAQVRRVGRVVPGAAAVITERCTRLAGLTGQGYDALGKRAIAWDDP